MASTVLIIGGGTGIGAAVARRMAADGWDVCVSGRRLAPLQEVAAAVGGLAVSADASLAEGAARAVDACVERFGRLDALVVSAGAGAGAMVAEQTLERWNLVISTNLTAPFLVCRAALAHLVESRGAIVTVASLAGLRADPASAAYCSSKAGLIMLTQCIALDYGPRGVRANTVCPGWIRTAMADEEIDVLAARRGVSREEAYAESCVHVPARRPGTPEEAAEAVAWLASPAASYVNGAVLTIDGGAAIVDAGTLAFAPSAG
jgi:meso-butanediol dehydrogenase/(S,S)-butanediol dehydrogenase/diacetyl reductase